MRIVFLVPLLAGTLLACAREPDAVEPGKPSARVLAAATELIDDPQPGARIGEVIPANRQVYQVFVVTETYATTSINTSAQFAYSEYLAGSGPASLTDAQFKAMTVNWKKFSVPARLFNTYLKKTVDRGAYQDYYHYDRDHKTWYKVFSQPADNHEVWGFLPKYMYFGIRFGKAGNTWQEEFL